MKPYIEDLNKKRSQVLSYLQQESGFSFVVGFLTMSIIIYLIFGIKLSETQTTIVKNILTVCLIYLTITQLNIDSKIAKASFIAFLFFGVNMFFNYVYKTKPEENV
tara:strand:- start:80 stop:397 length:318 start_codon:yes stop_codon:yes gene_type:complete